MSVYVCLCKVECVCMCVKERGKKLFGVKKKKI